MLPKELGLALACLLVWLAHAANADVIYRYTGNPFTTVPSPYAVGDFVSGTLQLSVSIPANAVNESIAGNTPITLDAYSFSDGVGALTSVNSLDSGLEVSTDGSGVITAWSFSSANSAGHSIGTENEPILVEDHGSTDITVQEASVVNNPGIWTVVPEPSTGLLVAAGTLSLVGAKRRRWVVRA
jgi:hypothetical protein